MNLCLGPEASALSRPLRRAPSRPETTVAIAQDRQRGDSAAVRARSYFGKAWAGAAAAVRTLSDCLKGRYGPRYTRVMVVTAFVTLFLPMPGISLGGVAAVALIAEAHRAIGLTIFRRGSRVTCDEAINGRARSGEGVMPTQCDVIVAWNATPEQLSAVGAALWRWWVRGLGARDIYPYLDNQVLADLIAGRLPARGGQPQPADMSGVHCRVWNRASDGGASIDTLRRELPVAGVVNVLVDGRSWDRVG